MLLQAVLDLRGGEPPSTHLEHVVIAARVVEEAVLVLPDHVAGGVPLAAKDLLSLVHLVPIRDGPRRSAHPEEPGFSARQFAAIVVAHPHVEPGYREAEAAGPDIRHGVSQKDVPHLRRPESVEQRHAKEFLPSPVKLFAQCLARRGGRAQTAQVLLCGVSVRGHLMHHRGHIDENGRAMAGNLREQGFGRALLVKQHGGSANRKWKDQVRPGGVTEEEFRHGQCDVALDVAHGTLRVELGGVDERAVRLHHSLRAPGGSTREEPDRGIVTMRLETLELVARRLEARLESLGPGNEHLAKCRLGGARLPEERGGASFGDDDFRARVFEEVLDLILLEARVRHDYRGADLQCRKERCDPVEAIA